MLEFARTAEAIAATSSKLAKTRILADYLRSLSPADLATAVVFMTGRPFGPREPRTLNLGWASVAAVVETLAGRSRAELSEVFLKHSDPGEWAAEVLAGRTRQDDVPLAEVAAALQSIRDLGTAQAKQERLLELVERLDPLSVKYLVKVLTGDLRIGLQGGLVEESIAAAFDVPAAQVRRLHMLTGDLAETAVRCLRQEHESAAVALLQPIRFMLATAVETPDEAMTRMGAGAVWTEEKYDGVRCQLHRSGDRVALFSRDLRETSLSFPEITEAAAALDHDLLLDGEILGHREGRVLRFFELQKRLGRKVVSPGLRQEVPVVLVAFDLLLLDGEVLLDRPLRERRALLERLDLQPPFLLARCETATGASDLERIFAETRERGNEGLMLKNPESPYTPGRRGMSWLKLKRPLATLDVVVTAVEWGHGKRRGVLSDYTFAVLDEPSGRLADVGKAYSGLTDAEISAMTRHFLSATVEDQGRRRLVKPDTVIEVAFDSIQRSNRHSSGYALRFPRIVRLRDDKPVAEIDTLDHVRQLYERYFGDSRLALAEVAEVST